jgi:hypothetical protein
MWNIKMRMQWGAIYLLSTFMMEVAISNGFGIKRLRTSKACRKQMGQ